jgi:DNA polymerase III subunit epsilon
MQPITNHSTQNAIQRANEWIAQKPIYLDTETTGVNRQDEIVEISILDSDGSVLFESLVKPKNPIPMEAQRIHGISNTHVASAPAWPILWPRVRELLYGRPIAAYNASFDLRMMKQSYENFGLHWKENLLSMDVMLLYSDYQAVWDPIRSSMKYFKLDQAGQFFQIKLHNSHRSTSDALLTRAVLHSIAGQSY